MNVLKELGGWASLDMVLRYAHLGADHLAEHAERIAKPRIIRTNYGTAIKKRLAVNSGKALIYLVGRVRFERTTNRLKVCCSTG